MKSVSIDLPHWNGLHQTRSEPRAFTEHTTKAFEQGFNYPKYDEMILSMISPKQSGWGSAVMYRLL
ncbi:MAG: hypothetical protein ACOYKN_12135 [Pirellula sp.]|jgi:hypothetical protein